MTGVDAGKGEKPSTQRTNSAQFQHFCQLERSWLRILLGLAYCCCLSNIFAAFSWCERRSSSNLPCRAKATNSFPLPACALLGAWVRCPSEPQHGFLARWQRQKLLCVIRDVSLLLPSCSPYRCIPGLPHDSGRAHVESYFRANPLQHAVHVNPLKCFPHLFLGDRLAPLVSPRRPFPLFNSMFRSRD